MMSENLHSLPPENPYKPPAYTLLVLTESAEEKHLRAFVGSKAEYYLKNWSPLADDLGRSSGFNWAAFLFPSLWLTYRKMYMAATIFYAIFLAVSIADVVLFVDILGKAEIPAALGQLEGFVAGSICGMLGNEWYLSHARKVVCHVRAEGFEERATVKMLSRRGGTSLVASLVFFLMFKVTKIAVFTIVIPALR